MARRRNLATLDRATLRIGYGGLYPLYPLYPRSRTESDDQNADADDAARGATGAVTPLILIYVFLSTLQHGERPSRLPQGRS